MRETEEAKKLIISGKFRDASGILDRIIQKNRDDDTAWYLRGLVSLRLNNHDYAHECFEYAIANKRSADYFKVDGIAYMEMLELEQAIASFEQAIHLDNGDAELFVYLAICHILLNSPESRKYMEKAYLRDRKKTREMVRSFYSSIFSGDHSVRSAVRRELEARIDSIA